MASSVVQQVARLAHKTFAEFSRTGSVSVVGESLPALTRLVHRVTGEHLGLDKSRFREITSRSVAHAGRAPVTYMHLFEDAVLSMGVFVVRTGQSIPLHDHRGMFGVIKVLHGAMRVGAFTEVDEDVSDVPDDILKRAAGGRPDLLKCVRPIPELIVDDGAPPCVLTPTVGNYHRVSAPNEPVAFFDILAPPYDHDTGSRECYYYRELNTAREPTAGDSSGQKNDTSYLIRINPPSEYWCDLAQYNGPAIHVANGA